MSKWKEKSASWWPKVAAATALVATLSAGKRW